MLLWLIPILPFAGFVINGLFGRRFSKAIINSIAIGSVVLAFAWVLKTLLGLGSLETAHIEHYFTWIQSGNLNIGCDFAVDRLTAIMLLVVTGIGSLIHIYAIGYMAHEGGYYRFFAYMNLFMFFMLVLVASTSIRSSPPTPATRHSSSTASATSVSPWRCSLSSPISVRSISAACSIRRPARPPVC